LDTQFSIQGEVNKTLRTIAEIIMAINLSHTHGDFEHDGHKVLSTLLAIVFGGIYSHGSHVQRVSLLVDVERAVVHLSATEFADVICNSKMKI